MASVSDGGSGRGDDVTVPGVLSDARSLICKLRDRERTSDHLMINLQNLSEKISSMKEYDCDLREMKETSGHKPGGRGALVHSLQQENRQIRQLQEENRQLKTLLEEHQSVMSLIMKRHREMMRQSTQLNRLEALIQAAYQSGDEHHSGRSDDDGPPKALSELEAHKVAVVFDRCLRMGETASHRDAAELAQLRTENAGLRELLRIGGKSEPRLVKLFLSFARDQARSDPSLKWSPADGDDDDASTPVEERSKENMSLESLIAVAASAAAAATSSGSEGSVIEASGDNLAAPSSSDSHVAVVLVNGGDQSAAGSGSGSDSSCSPNSTSPTGPAPKSDTHANTGTVKRQTNEGRRSKGGATDGENSAAVVNVGSGVKEDVSSQQPSGAGLVNGSPASELKSYLKSAGGAIKDKLSGSPTKVPNKGAVSSAHKTGTIKRADKNKTVVNAAGAKAGSPAAAVRT